MKKFLKGRTKQEKKEFMPILRKRLSYPGLFLQNMILMINVCLCYKKIKNFYAHPIWAIGGESTCCIQHDWLKTIKTYTWMGAL